MSLRHFTAGLLALSSTVGPCVGAELPSAEVSVETQFSDDITLTQTTARGNDRVGDWSWTVALTGATTDVEYVPVPEDIFGYATELLEPRIAGFASVNYAVLPRLTLLASVNAYEGFADYQSLWISEFDQQSFAGLPGLESPDPGGVIGSGGFRWEYQPGTGFLESSFIRAHAVIAPGYDEVIDPDEGLVGVTPLRSGLITTAWNLKLENLLSPRLRSQLEFRLGEQSEAGLRLSGIGSLLWAPAARWVVRFESGYTTEAPGTETASRFRAGWASLVVDRRIADHWWVSLSGRGYTDNGEIQDSISFSTSAPPLNAWQASVGLRGVWGRHSFKLSGGPYLTNYGPIDFSTLFFGNLYRDRTYGVIQASYRFEF